MVATTEGGRRGEVPEGWPVSDLALQTTSIEGLLVLRLPVHGDHRGWFKENWQREKMTVLGLPDFGPVQQNVSYNADVGTTRGLHAEPWDKLVSVTHGRAFGAWVDLRKGSGFGASFTVELTPGTCVFVPRGVANGYQTVEPSTSYSYLVNEHWSAQAREHYTFVNLLDEQVAIPWPLPVDPELLSEADRTHPRLAQVVPFRRPRPLVIGSEGQFGRALQDVYPEARFVDVDEFDLADPAAVEKIDWSEHDVIINAAAYTAVDGAETADGRRLAWQVNATGVGRLVEVARRHRLTLVHISTDYVFDGTVPLHSEDEPFTPLGVYGQSKAAGDMVVSTLPKHYLLRTTWVVGDGNNFVRTMARLADAGVSPQVVDDQLGRPTFTDELARAVRHLLEQRPAYGTYNVTCSGEVISWADLARAVFELRGRSTEDVTPVSTAAYAEGKDLALRPMRSALSLARIEATGFVPGPWPDELRRYLKS